MKRFLASLAMIVLLLTAGLAWLIASGRPMEETPEDTGLQFDELRLDYSALPGLLEFTARDGTNLHYRHYPVESDSAAETMALAARDLVAAGYDLIDLNYACPAPKVLRRGRGGALLLNPDLAIDILRSVREAVDCPVMIKLRVGNDHDPQRQACFWEIVERSLAEGVDALVIHGRTVHEKYRGVADWSLLKRVKQTFPRATIVGSGDCFDAEETITRLQETGLDGFIAARGAIGNPWFFQELRALFAGCPLPASPDLSEQKEVISPDK